MDGWRGVKEIVAIVALYTGLVCTTFGVSVLAVIIYLPFP